MSALLDNGNVIRLTGVNTGNLPAVLAAGLSGELRSLSAVLQMPDSGTPMRSIHVIHENPDWLPPLAAAFDRLRLPWTEWNLSGGVFDLSHPTLDSADELRQVLSYLAEGAPLLRTAAREPDVYDREGGSVVPLGYRTDGRWVWSEATAYYLATYGLSPDPRLLADIRANGYRRPAPPGPDGG